MPKHKVRAHIANEGTRDCLASDTTSRLPESNGLLVEGPIAAECSWGTPDNLQIAVMMEPTVATMSASCIVKDKVTWVTYMDTMITSMGQVALSGPNQGTPAKGPIIEDITDLS